MADYEDDAVLSEEQNAKNNADAAANKKQSFKEAFASARSGGGKEFEWNGKKYTTELAGEKKAPATSSKTTASTESAPAKSEAPAARVGRASQASTASTGPSMADRIAAEAVRSRKDRESGKSGFGGSQRSRPYQGMKAGGSVSSASRRGDGIASKGKTRGKLC